MTFHETGGSALTTASKLYIHPETCNVRKKNVADLQWIIFFNKHLDDVVSFSLPPKLNKIRAIIPNMSAGNAKIGPIYFPQFQWSWALLGPGCGYRPASLSGREFTSRKHCKKEPQSFLHCSSFDHPNMHLLNNYKFVLFGLPTQMLGIWGVINIPLGAFQRCITCPPKVRIRTIKQKKRVCNRLLTADQGGQKNRNGKTTAVLFATFSTSDYTLTSLILCMWQPMCTCC
jgi:hypothetical protein